MKKKTQIKLRLGDILLVKHYNWFGRLVSKITGSQFSHSVCYIGRKLIIESSKHGVKIENINKYSQYTVMRHKDQTKMHRKIRSAVSYMKEQIGKKYDYLGLIGIAYAIFARKKRNVLDGKNRFWCSELIADGYLQADIKLDVSDNTYKVSPSDLSKSLYLKEVGEYVRQ